MNDWFFVSAWMEKGETEIHFEIANEDGEQYFFWMTTKLVKEKLSKQGDNALDSFYYVEEDMLSLAVTILDEELLEEGEEVQIDNKRFEKYF